MSSEMQIDLGVDAWSSAGSFLQFRSPLASVHGSRGAWPLRLQSCRRSLAIPVNGGLCGGGELFDVDLLDTQRREVPYDASATADQLVLRTAAGGEAKFVFCGTDAIAFQLDHVSIRWRGCKPQGWSHQRTDGCVLVSDFYARSIVAVVCDRSDAIRLDRSNSRSAGLASDGLPRQADSILCFADDRVLTGLLCLNDAEPSTPIIPDYAEALQSKRREIAAWMAKMPEVEEEYMDAACFAWYTLWHHRVGPRGCLRRPAILMGRLWMNMTWPWDAAFAALGVGAADVDLAFDQLMLHLDHQTPSGQIPDHLHDGEAAYGFLKVPIQGWIIQQLIASCGDEACWDRLDEIYDPLSRWTRWWYEYRDENRNGMCQYHHGNDSGWDNSTVFDQGMPTEGVDLASYLVLQMEALGDIAEWLHKTREAEAWHLLAARQLETLLTLGMVDGKFASMRSKDRGHEPTLSLMPYLPLILGRRLPGKPRGNLIADLASSGRWLTPYGLATEAVDSPKYVEDGYWRGPIWAPPTWMIFSGLCDAGESTLAVEVARRFCRTVASQPGMYENYSATTGRGLRCPTYAWTAAVFVRLAHWLHNHTNHACISERDTPVPSV